MDSLAKRLEVGYEKLYRWVQTEGRALPQHEVPPTFVAALALLRHMPVYYRSALLRRVVVVCCYIDRLRVAVTAARRSCRRVGWR